MTQGCPYFLSRTGGGEAVDSTYVLYMLLYIYVSCSNPSEVIEDASKLCLNELCCAISFSGGFLGNKDVLHNTSLLTFHHFE